MGCLIVNPRHYSLKRFGLARVSGTELSVVAMSVILALGRWDKKIRKVPGQPWQQSQFEVRIGHMNSHVRNSNGID